MVGKRTGVHRAKKPQLAPASERRAPSSHGDGGGGVECDRMRCCCDGRAPPGPRELAYGWPGGAKATYETRWVPIIHTTHSAERGNRYAENCDEVRRAAGLDGIAKYGNETGPTLTC